MKMLTVLNAGSMTTLTCAALGRRPTNSPSLEDTFEQTK